MRQLKITHSITNRELDSITRYLEDISKIPLLSDDEEIALGSRIQSQDASAIDELARHNLRFVVSVAKQFQNQGLPLPDLINEGNLGLIEAAKRFEVNKGFKFISYAVWWIRQSILRAIAEQSDLIRKPLNIGTSIKTRNKTFSILTQQLEREPTDEEMENFLKVKKGEKIAKQIVDINQFETSTSSLNMLLNDDSGSATGVELQDIFSSEDKRFNPEAGLNDASLSEELETMLAAINPPQAQVIKLKHGIGQDDTATNAMIAKKLDLTEERVRQLYNAGKRSLQKHPNVKNLRKYLG